MTTHDPTEHVIELMGVFLQEDGLPRIAGQILGLLVARGEAMTLTEIAEALGVSKASVSTNCRLLAEKGALERIGTLGTRQDSYRAADDPAGQTLRTMAQRFDERARALDAAAHDFSDAQAPSRDRVQDLASFFRNSAAFLAQWDQAQALRGADRSDAARTEHETGSQNPSQTTRHESPRARAPQE